jgi:dephospho-CoA kinase
MLRGCGAAVIDSDELNRAELSRPEVIRRLRLWWGDSVLDNDGRVDRARVAEIVFHDPEQRIRLEQLLHPRIARERERLIETHQRDDAVVAIVLDTPLLVESNLVRRCDVVVFVDAEFEVRRERAVAHRGWSEEDWMRREKSQNALDKKRERADYVLVNNSSDLAQLCADVRTLFEKVVSDFERDDQANTPNVRACGPDERSGG